jgi:hypothetical protein
VNGHDYPDVERLLRYVDGELSPKEMNATESHLRECPSCLDTVLMMLEFRDAETIGLAEAAPSPETPTRTAGDSQAGKILGIGGAIAGLAELLRGLGRGGMRAAPGLAASLHGTHALTSENISPPGARNLPPHASSDTDANHGASHSGEHTMQTVHESGFHHAPTQYGIPEIHGQSDLVHQNYSDTCAIQCQHLILNQFGDGTTETDLAREAAKMGIYKPGEGTRLEDVGKLLEAHGVPVHREMNANVFNLATELAQGHKVMVGVNSGELWHTNGVLESIANALGIAGADHAVIVSGIDTHDPDHVRVVVTDPGTGDVAKSYPIQEFLDAWHGSHFSLVATTVPAPHIDPGMVNFDFEAGHISHIGAMPYDVAHDFSAEAHHEEDPAVLHNLENAFLHLVHGEGAAADIFSALPRLGSGGSVAGIIHSMAGLSHGQPGSHEISSWLSSQGHGSMGDWFHSLFESAHGQDPQHLHDPHHVEHHDPHHDVHHDPHHDIHDAFDHHDDGQDFDSSDEPDSGAGHE